MVRLGIGILTQERRSKFQEETRMEAATSSRTNSKIRTRNSNHASLARRANRGDSVAAWMLGETYLSRCPADCGNETIADRRCREKGLAWLRKAVILGHPDAMISLANEWSHDRTQASLENALKLEKDAWKKHAFAAAWNAAVTCSLLNRPRSCMAWIRRALREDFPDARILLGVALAAGYGTRKNVSAAMRTFRGIASDSNADSEDRELARRYVSRLQRGWRPVVDRSIALVLP